MALFALGDIQGCYGPMMRLLEQLRFDPSSDVLWFTGDLVNRGPDSARVLRFVRDLGKGAITVLGNHDLHLLAVAFGAATARHRDTLDDVLDAPDADELIDWLRRQRLIHHDAGLAATLVHAGLLPQWNTARACQLAHEVESVLRGDDALEFFNHMYGDEPDSWSDSLSGWDRLRLITNVLTRLRYCTRDGQMDFIEKGAPGKQAPGLLPWFEIEHRKSQGERIVFGHWSTLPTGEFGPVISLDSGCLWGGRLTAVRLDDPESTTMLSVKCTPVRRPGID